MSLAPESGHRMLVIESFIVMSEWRAKGRPLQMSVAQPLRQESGS
ncbi:hypothetical protein ACPOL_0478 [Acidisarcina polymorpha]|uniref:Uncharacterized protein n=1 Tax=Acidisarcina polymorpha TaxID=2211140 RepID=A0A2Z5FSR8_9BACT|nr:hypothetical protein ACPOL_0478 [Acidisarcina polymorpha]